MVVHVLQDASFYLLFLPLSIFSLAEPQFLAHSGNNAQTTAPHDVISAQQIRVHTYIVVFRQGSDQFDSINGMNLVLNRLTMSEEQPHCSLIQRSILDTLFVSPFPANETYKLREWTIEKSEMLA